MFVVNTIPQLEEAIRESVREVMVVGKLAPEMLEMTDCPIGKANCDYSTNPCSTQVSGKFNILAVRDRSQKVIATIFQRRDNTLIL